MTSRKRAVSAVPTAPSILPLCSSDVTLVPIVKEDDDGKRGTGYNYKNTSILDGLNVPVYQGQLEVTTLLQHQVAGSAPFLKVLQPEGLVCKPAVPRELWFYITAGSLPGYDRLLADFHGCVRLSSDAVQLAEKSVHMDSLVTPWAKQMAKSSHRQAEEHSKLPKHQGRYMVLEDYTSKMKHPCVMDIKIGTRAHGLDASPSKAASQIKKCKATTSAGLGLRICGLQVYHPGAGYRFMHKYEGRKLTESTFPRAVQQFFHNGTRVRTEVVEQFLPKLRDVQATTARGHFKLYSTSLLLVYEGQRDEDEDGGERAGDEAAADTTRLCMIDFAHTFARTASDENDENDDGYQFGIGNFIQILEDILKYSRIRRV